MASALRAGVRARQALADRGDHDALGEPHRDRGRRRRRLGHPARRLGEVAVVEELGHRPLDRPLDAGQAGGGGAGLALIAAEPPGHVGAIVVGQERPRRRRERRGVADDAAHGLVELLVAAGRGERDLGRRAVRVEHELDGGLEGGAVERVARR
ncbi:MAG: hypothetical protein IPL61_02960 [Myxococcales bacterium]|nr:hypothetical protein [Myxococcales bacterium]